MWKLLILSCLLSGILSDVRLPPRFVKQPEKEIIFETADKNVYLYCEAEGIPEVEYTWQKDGNDFELNKANIQTVPGTGSFFFKEIYALDAGYYQCFAENQYGKAMSKVSSVQRAYLGSFPSRPEPLEHTVNVGDPLKVSCNAPKSYPTPAYQWVLADSTDDTSPATITESRRMMWDLNGDLHFVNTELNDHQGGRIYLCQAYNPAYRTERSGSETIINVDSNGTPPSTRPNLIYGPESTAVAVMGEDITFQCIFSGFPTPSVQFQRVGKQLRYNAVETDKYGTVMKIKNVMTSDQGEYKCEGSNSKDKSEKKFFLDVQIRPNFTEAANKPHNMNRTEGEDAVFVCDAQAKPEVTVTWFKNGNPIDSGDPGPKMSVTDNGKKLTIKDVCKTCAQSDLMVIQCNASNVHGYAFAEGYLNVLLRTVLVTTPQDVNMEDWTEIVFPCSATTDDSTPLEITWFFNDVEIDLGDEAYSIVPEGLKVDVMVLEEREKGKAAGKYTCKATNGLSTEAASAMLTLPADPAPVITTSSINWLLIIVIVVVVLLLIIILLLIMCCLCCRKNKGEEYLVDEKEKKAGLNPEKELQDNGFQDYQRPESQPFKGSRASLSSTIKLDDSDDEESLAEYGEPDTGKFNEDGSFIGEYHERRKHRGGDSIV